MPQLLTISAFTFHHANDSAFEDDTDTVGQAHDLIQIFRNKKNTGAILAQFQEQLPGVADGLGIESLGGMGGDDDGRLAPGFATQDQPLDIPPGKNTALCLPQVRHQRVETRDDSLGVPGYFLVV